MHVKSTCRLNLEVKNPFSIPGSRRKCMTDFICGLLKTLAFAWFVGCAVKFFIVIVHYSLKYRESRFDLEQPGRCKSCEDDTPQGSHIV